jgi:SNF2 family DNA or RNA helicase
MEQPPSTTWSVDPASLKRFIEATSGTADSREWFDLRRKAEELARVPGFDTLITLDANTIKELPHQIDVALRVLRRPMNGRAILADEVGLGKTIEAGIVLKELVVRGLARRILILTPAALVDQWCGELESKFFETFDTPSEPEDWRQTTRGIASYDRATRQGHQEAILKHTWDLVILDEAHKVKNEKAARFKFISKIQRNYILLLTATPLQNDLRELYNLVTLLRPGQLGTWREFAQRYLVSGDRRRAKNPASLRDLTSQVMIRTRRASVAHTLELPRRLPHHPSVRLTPPERQLYGSTVAFLRDLYANGFIQPTRDEIDEDTKRRKKRTGKGIQALEVIRLCQRLCSSSLALGESLSRLADGELITPEYRTKALELAATAKALNESAKREALSRVLDEHREQVIVFSEHLPTLDLIRWRVEAHGRKPVVYQGGLSRQDRARRLKAFKDSPNSVFIATRAGTEGLNLQFCNVLVNYELPWNPMIIEQRIGRIHRIGQKRDAHIINLAADDTIEAHILRLLDRKIKLFELVVGELDVILGEFGGAESLEERITSEFLKAKDERDLDRAMESIGNEIVQSREAGLEQERIASEVSADDNAMRLEREFSHLTIPARVRLGYGTKHLAHVQGIEARRELLGLHVGEVMEALEQSEVRDAEYSREYGPLVTIHGVTRRGRAVHVTVQADRLPMLLVAVDADPIRPL